MSDLTNLIDDKYTRKENRERRERKKRRQKAYPNIEKKKKENRFEGRSSEECGGGGKNC